MKNHQHMIGFHSFCSIIELFVTFYIEFGIFITFFMILTRKKTHKPI